MPFILLADTGQFSDLESCFRMLLLGVTGNLSCVGLRQQKFSLLSISIDCNEGCFLLLRFPFSSRSVGGTIFNILKLLPNTFIGRFSSFSADGTKFSPSARLKCHRCNLASNSHRFPDPPKPNSLHKLFKFWYDHCVFSEKTPGLREKYSSPSMSTDDQRASSALRPQFAVAPRELLLQRRFELMSMRCVVSSSIAEIFQEKNRTDSIYFGIAVCFTARSSYVQRMQPLRTYYTFVCTYTYTARTKKKFNSQFSS